MPYKLYYKNKSPEKCKAKPLYTTSHPLKGYYQEKHKITNVREDVEKLEPLCTVSGNGKWCSHCEKQHGNSSTLNTEFVSDPEIPLLGIDPEEVKTATQNRLFIHPCL